MKKKRLIIYGILALVVVIQLIPVERPAVSSDNPNDIMKHADVPDNVAKMLKAACYDCHSNETVYPWYSYVAPIKWLVYRDTREGRKELNFSEWDTLGSLDKATALDDIASEVEEGEMPMKIYPLMHKEAKLSDQDRQAIIDWANDAMEKVFE